MIYRIVATILLLIAIVAAGVLLEYDEPAAPKASRSAPASNSDDSAMKSLRIN